jgi:8-oxo-dGTP pyrophosphatase MutT (NUDIX family)
VKNEKGKMAGDQFSIELRTPIVKSALIIVERGYILMVRRGRLQPWELPGGKPLGAESPRQALVRESCEELGVSVVEDSIRSLGTFVTKATIPNENELVCLLCFHAEYVGIPQPSCEIVEAKWIPLGELEGESINGSKIGKWIAARIEDSDVTPFNFAEVETSRYCNRSCSWCPNGHFKARQKQELMNTDVFRSIVADLGLLDYRGWLSLHNYNEPLLNPRIEQELLFARAVLPATTLALFSNGDHLTLERLEELSRAGLNHLRITLYPKSDITTVTGEDAQRRVEKWLAAKRIHWTQLNIVPVRQGFAAILNVLEVDCEIIVPNIANYNYRGGTCSDAGQTPRVSRCSMTTTSVAIDYRGRYKMCCNVFPEALNHEEYVVGFVGEKSLLNIYESSRMSSLRQRHLKGDWSASPICRFCHHYLPEDQK